jgi:hypothetical protein
MPTDHGLALLFQQNIEGHWQRVETGGVGLGVPDLNYCILGREGWIETKYTAGWKVAIRPHQIAWIERRNRAGGRVFVAIRRSQAKTVRHGKIDELYLFYGTSSRDLADKGLRGVTEEPVYVGTGGPAKWDWTFIRSIITRE